MERIGDMAKLLAICSPVGRPKHVATQICFRKGHVTFCEVHVDSWHRVREGYIRYHSEDKRYAKEFQETERDKEA